MLIFIVLCFIMAIGAFTAVKGMAPWITVFVCFGPLFILILYSFHSKLEVYEDGITFRMYHVYFDKPDNEIELKWDGRLLVLGKYWFIVLNPREFAEAIEDVKPD